MAWRWSSRTTATNDFEALGPRAPVLELHIAQKQQANPTPLSLTAHFRHETGGSEAWRHVLGDPAMPSLQWCEAPGRAWTASPSLPPRSPRGPCGRWHSARAVSELRTGHSEVGAGPELAYRTSRKSRHALAAPGLWASCGSACPWSSEVPLQTLGPGFGQKWRKGVEQRLLAQEEVSAYVWSLGGPEAGVHGSGGRFSLVGIVSFFPFLFFFF